MLLYYLLSGVWYYWLEIYFKISSRIPLLSGTIQYLAFVLRIYTKPGNVTQSLFIGVGLVSFSSMSYNSLSTSLSVSLLSVPSTTSSLSFSSSFDGSVDHQDDVSSPSHPSQYGVSPVLNECQPHDHGQSLNVKPSSHSNTLKLRVGSNDSPKVSATKPKLCPQFRKSQPPWNLSLGQGSDSSVLVPQHIPVHDIPPNTPTTSTEELLACYLLGRVWGEPIPLPAIIHRTRNDWKFVKGHIEYVDIGNHWILI